MMNCRHCGTPLRLGFLDLGASPPSNAYLSAEQLDQPETWYPLRVMTCTRCWLVQTQDYAHHAELFAGDYAYFSSFSDSWLEHTRCYVQAVRERFALDGNSTVCEVAANDGYLLQYVQQAGIPCYGIEPTAGTAAVARAKGIDIVERFFGMALADELAAQERQADLVVANNVLAHVPDINDFVAGFARLLKAWGVATFEFPHLLRLVQENQFDTIYHEHFSYLSFGTARRIFEAQGLTVFDVEELPTHGGSLRVFVQRSESGRQPVSARVAALLQQEAEVGLSSPDFYAGFQRKADAVKDAFVAFLLEAKRAGRSVAAYGAAAKGNTLMNYAGIRPDLIAFVVDRNPAKQGKFMPGSRIPVFSEEQLKAACPDYVVILPWNLRIEVTKQLAYVRSWGGRLVTAVPRLEVWP